MWGKFFGWIATNLALPIFWEAVKRFSERKKFIESSAPDAKEEKLEQVLKEDGFDVK